MAFLILKIGHLTLLTTVTYNNCKPTHKNGELDYKTRKLWATWRWRLKRCKKYKFSWVTCKLDNISRAREEKCIKYRWRSTSCRAKHLSGRSLTHHTCSIFCSCSRVILFWVPIGYGSRWSLLIGRRCVLCREGEKPKTQNGNFKWCLRARSGAEQVGLYFVRLILGSHASARIINQRQS